MLVNHKPAVSLPADVQLVRRMTELSTLIHAWINVTWPPAKTITVHRHGMCMGYARSTDMR